MKRNLIGVAMTSLLIPAGLLVGAAPSGAASSPQPTISAVSAPAATSHSGGVYNGSTIGYADSFTFTVSGTNLTSVKKPDISVIQSPAATADGSGKWTLKGAPTIVGGNLTFTAIAPAIKLTTLNGYPVEPNGGAIKVKFTSGSAKYSPVSFMTSYDLGSNCGPTDAALAPLASPVNSVTGAPYVAGDFGSNAATGQVPTSLQATLTGSTKPTVYSNVYLVNVHALGSTLTWPANTRLCAADVSGITSAAVGPLNHSGFQSWASNYPLYFPTATNSAGTVNNVGFKMPYASSNTVKVSNTVIKFQAADPSKITGCKVGAPSGTSASKLAAFNAAIDTASSAFTADYKKTTCLYNAGTGVVTISDSQSHSYTAGTFLNSPDAVLQVSGSTSLSIKSIQSTISVSGLTANIGFNPDSTSPNFGATVLNW